MNRTLTTTVACAPGWQASGLAAWGSAPHAAVWICLEHPGPFGRKAATETRGLDPAVGAALDERCAQLGGKLLLIRRASRTRPDGDPLTVLVAGDLPAGGWLHRFLVNGAEELLAWLESWDGARPAVTDTAPVLLLCTNAKRDQCCSRYTRPVLAELSDLPPGQVWESSHLGGHRFAPTALVLPTGQALAGVDDDIARQALAHASQGRLWPGGRRHDRGRTHLPPDRQAAEAWGLERFGVLAPEALSSVDVGDGVVEVRHGDHVQRVSVSHVTSACNSPLSCGKDPEPLVELQVEGAP